jgi:O-methyltransferase
VPSFGKLRTFAPLRRAYERHPRVQPLVREVYALVARRPQPTFFGWLMTTHHQLPWVDAHRWSTFRGALDTARSLQFTDPGFAKTIGALEWRHWNVAYAVVHAVDHTASRSFTAVECGVHDGVTAHFALNELDDARRRGDIDDYTMHLYDAWAAMRDEELSESERVRTGWYADLAEDRTRGNLSSFADHLVFHRGYIPESLVSTAPPPEQVDYLHIDLNAAGPTIAACELFWPRLAPGSVVLFDDYGWLEYAETKEAVDAFFASRPGTLLKLPTGQAMYFR